MYGDKKLAEYIRQWGSAASIKLLEPASQLFTTHAIEGCIGYRIEGKCIAVFGDPVAAPEDKIALTLAFHEWIVSLRKEVVYITVSQEFIEWASHHVCKTVLEIGEELILNPHVDIKEGSAGRVIRRKTNHARSAGVTIHELFEKAGKLYNAVQEISLAWVRARAGMQIYYTSVEVFEEMERKRYFYALQGGKVVGVVMLYYLDRSSGWVIHMLMTIPDAPPGTPELLISSITETLSREGCSFLSFGVVQAAGLGKVIGLGKLGTWTARTVFRTAQKMFSLEGRRLFWMKFRPQSTRTFVACSRQGMGISELLAIKKTFNVS